MSNLKKHFRFGGKCRIRLQSDFQSPHLAPDEALRGAKELNPHLPVELVDERTGLLSMIDTEVSAFYYNVDKDLDLEKAAYMVAKAGAEIIEIDPYNHRIITRGIISGL